MSWYLGSSFGILIATYIVLLVILPSGSIFGVNVKILCFALLLAPALRNYFSRRRAVLEVAALLFLPSVLGLWVLLSQFYGFDLLQAFAEYREILTTLISCWVVAVFCDVGDVETYKFLQWVLQAEGAACILKLLLLAYAFARGVPVSLLVDQISAIFGVQLMGLDFESALGRIQFVSDGLIPICLFMLLRYRRALQIRVSRSTILFVLLLLSLIFTFSRYFWAFGALAVLLAMTGGKKDRFHLLLGVLLGIMVLASLPMLTALYELRFSTAVAGGSDSVRTLQIPALERFFLEAPVLGHGFGSYPTEVLRNYDHPYLYEVQLCALAGQEGIVGLLLMALLVFHYFRPLWLGIRVAPLQEFVIGVLVLGWLSSGLFNPMLFNSAAALSYASLRALAALASGLPSSEQEALGSGSGFFSYGRVL